MPKILQTILFEDYKVQKKHLLIPQGTVRVAFPKNVAFPPQKDMGMRQNPRRTLAAAISFIRMRNSLSPHRPLAL